MFAYNYYTCFGAKSKGVRGKKRPVILHKNYIRFLCTLTTEIRLPLKQQFSVKKHLSMAFAELCSSGSYIFHHIFSSSIFIFLYFIKTQAKRKRAVAFATARIIYYNQPAIIPSFVRALAIASVAGASSCFVSVLSFDTKEKRRVTVDAPS